MSGRFWLISILTVLATLLVGFRVLGQSPEELLSDNNTHEEVEVDGGLEVLSVGGVEVSVEVADEPEEMSLGLGSRESLDENQGMLFVYPTAMQPRFWMKGMEFPLDFLWIREGVVVEILENVPEEIEVSDENKTIYFPSEEVDMVLEVNAGWIQNKGIRVGDEVEVSGLD